MLAHSCHRLTGQVIALFLAWQIDAVAAESGAAPDVALPKRVRVASVQMEPGGSQLQNIMVFSFGMGFKEKDLPELERTLRASIDSAQGTTSAAGEEWTLHTIIRSFKVVTDNKSGYAVACVAWCMADSDAKPVYHEQFFATAGGRAFAGLGAEGKVKKAIVERISATAMQLRSLHGSELRPPSVERTYDSFEQATKNFPAKMRPSGWSVVQGGRYYRLAVNPDWDWANRPENIRWAEVLGSEEMSVDRSSVEPTLDRGRQPAIGGDADLVEVRGAATIKVSVSFDSAGKASLERMWMEVHAGTEVKTLEISKETKFLDPEGNEIALEKLPSVLQVLARARELGGKLHAEIVTVEPVERTDAP